MALKDILIASGIYTITNTVNGKIYVGSAINLSARRREHRSSLLRGRHHNVKLQHAWSKYGPAAFVFSIVEIVEDANFLLAREQFWLWRTDASVKGYNILLDASSRLGIKHSSSTRAKIGEAGRGLVCSAEHRAATSKSLMGLKRPPFTPEHRAALSAAHSGKRKPRTKEHQEKLSSSLRGRKKSAETRAKMSAAAKARSPERVATIALMLKRARESKVHPCL